MKKAFLLLAFFSFLIVTISQADEGRILRFPNASQSQIAFCYGGDIYTVPIAGGLARKVTNSDGIELFPRFSPDGSQLAFSAEYDGNREIYSMPSQGGSPKRLTYSMDIQGLPERMGPDKIIMQWNADGKSILYRSRQQSWNAWVGKLFNVSLDGTLPVELPLPRGGFASMSPDGSKIAYNRVFREFRTWKRYRGGQADDIWIYDFTSKKLENITNNVAQDIIPMWWKDKIYFISDRDHELNLFVYDLKTKLTKKITNFDKYDVKFPSLGADNITFENGGYIYLLDCNTDQYKKVNIEIAGDFPYTRAFQQNVKNRISSFDISPDGNRGLFTARGDVFTVPAEKGKIRNLTKSTGVHDREAIWSPDGKYIAYISDKSGENEIYLVKPDGSELTQLTNASKSYLWEMSWSPDSKKIIFSDKTLNVYYIDISTKQITTFAKSKEWEIRNYKWSPDSKWIAYTDQLANGNASIYLYSLANAKSYQITDEFFSSADPEFSADGKYLFFVSDRTFSARTGAFEWNFLYENMSKIYGLTLQDSLESPFAFKSIDAKIIEDKESKDDKESKKSKKKKDGDEEVDNTIKIDLQGLRDRIFELPVPASNYYHLSSTKGKLYYSRGGDFFVFDFDKNEESKVSDFGAFNISADHKKIIFAQDGSYFISDLKDNIKGEKGKLDLSEMTVELNRHEEWKQIYDECWRQMRDFFYDPNMHGVDWKNVHDKYAEMVPSVTHRFDLTYLIGEMIGELNVGHAYVGGGDMERVESVPIGLLGVDLVSDESGFFKIKKILKGRNWDDGTYSPLTVPGIDIKEGEYLLAIDGEKLAKDTNPYKYMVGKANKFVTLKVNSKPIDAGSREYTVKTISSEKGLRYFNWVENNRHIVDSLTNGKVGYVHIPDMSMDGLNEFVKYFYPQTRKAALIVDDRYNGGGNVSPMIIERLRRILLLAKNLRNQEDIGTHPDAVMTGPMVCLLNEISASDGDMFPYQFKRAGLGTLIGKRSWGGVIGIRGSLPILDGGYLYKPEFAHLSTDGKWILEGVGMTPDIEVENDPTNEYNGIDDQLNKAIEVILEQIKTDTKPKLPERIPTYPDKK